MYQHERDLSSFELWHASIERSQRRRVLAADGRRRVARRKQARREAERATAAARREVGDVQAALEDLEVGESD